MSPRKRRDRSKGYAIVWTERACADLAAIGDFIAADDPDAAARWIGTLMAAVEKAAAMPHMGRRIPERDRDDVREVLRRSYRVVYRVRDDRIEVLTIFEGHRLFPHDAVPDDD